MNHRRTMPLILALSGLVLSACAAGAPAEPKSGRQLVLDRLAKADDAPYSAALKAVTQSGTRRLQLMTGRVNLNAPLTGRTTDRTEQYTEDVVYTPHRVYRRAIGSDGAWQKFPASTAKGGIPTDRLAQYARLVLDHSGKVSGGDGTVRVSARLTPKDVEAVDKAVGRNLRSAKSFGTDVWIDTAGRVVRVRQDIHVASDGDIRNTLTLSDFERPVRVTAPADA